MRYLVRAGSLSGYGELVRRAGGNPRTLLKEAGIPLAALENPECYVSYPALANLYTLTASSLRMPTFGLELGARQGLDVVGALGAWIINQPRIADALAGIRQHLAFHARGIDIVHERHAEVFTLRLVVRFSDRVSCMQLMTLSTALLMKGLQDLVAGEYRPINVRLGFSNPSQEIQQACRDVFKCPVTFGNGIYEICYHLALLEAPIATSDVLKRRLMTHWRGSETADGPLPVSKQVERVMVALLPTGDCSLEQVARLVGRHPRTLQTNLMQEGTRYERLLAETRMTLAKDHLINSDIALTRLALDLGYADLPTFSSAFRKWTGLAPTRWRQSQKVTMVNF